MNASPMVQIENLQVTFKGSGASGRPVRAVNGVSLQVARGETVALIGESGSGKSVTLRALLRLHPVRRTEISGRIEVAGQDILSLGPRALADYRGRVASMIFQEPLLALDPVYTVGQQITESIRRHEPQTSAAQARARALELFERVRIPSPERRLDAYPHEMLSLIHTLRFRRTLPDRYWPADHAATTQSIINQKHQTAVFIW